MTSVSSWGRLSNFDHQVIELCDRQHLDLHLQNSQPGTVIGMARSYGDVCLNPEGVLWSATSLDRFISFDAQTGILVCEAGVLLKTIQDLMIPRGWVLPVTPGTQLITVGGALANDVHGKSHHRTGTFGNHVQWLRLQRTDGEVIECGPNLKADWFAATVGGLGLTGLIAQVAIKLKPIAGPWVTTENIPYATLDEFFELSKGSEQGWEHSVSWIDCITGEGERGVFMRGNYSSSQCPAPSKAGKLAVPFVPPLSLVNRFSLRPFNLAYYWLQTRKKGSRLEYYESYFYPLDNIKSWNRIYGPRGFYQYQSVVPWGDGEEAVKIMLKAISDSGDGSFLGVLKTFGDIPSQGLLSFAQPGITLALDFPNCGSRTLRLFERLDAIVAEVGGRLYPAKDARMPVDMFARGYPQLERFIEYRDPGISSALSRRLLGS